MLYTATLTSKGQVTVPVAIRRMLGLKSRDKVVFEEKVGSVVIKKAADLLSLRGSLGPKNYVSDRVADKAVRQYIAKQYEQKLKRS